MARLSFRGRRRHDMCTLCISAALCGYTVQAYQLALPLHFPGYAAAASCEQLGLSLDEYEVCPIIYHHHFCLLPLACLACRLCRLGAAGFLWGIEKRGASEPAAPACCVNLC